MFRVCGCFELLYLFTTYPEFLSDLPYPADTNFDAMGCKVLL
jgi:hypothetical protein